MILRWVTGSQKYITFNKASYLPFHKTKKQLWKSIRESEKKTNFFSNFYAKSTKKFEKNINFFNINISWTNACCLLIFWWNTTLDTLKSLNQNFFTILHFFMMLAILIYVKKIGEICLVSWKNKDMIFWV